MSSTTVLTLPTATLAEALVPPTAAVTFVSPSPLAAAVKSPPAETVPRDESATDQVAACAGIWTVFPALSDTLMVTAWLPLGLGFDHVNRPALEIDMPLTGFVSE